MGQYGIGAAQDTENIPSEFAPKGEPKSLSDDGSANAAGDSSEPGRALAEFAALGKGEKISGILGSGKTSLPSKPSKTK